MRALLGLGLGIVCVACTAKTPPPSAPTATVRHPDCPEGTREHEWVGGPGVIRDCEIAERSEHGESYRQGPTMLIDGDGKVLATGQWVDNKEQGLWRWWHPNGKLSREATYEAGQVVSDASWNDAGVPIDRHDATGQTTWWPNGNKRDYLKVTTESYERTAWYENGNMARQEKSGAEGKRESAEWFESGQKREEASFNKDGKMTAWQGWSSNGAELTCSTCVDDADCVLAIKNECWVCNPPYEPLTRADDAKRKMHPPAPPDCPRNQPVPPCKKAPAPRAACDAKASKCVIAPAYGD